MSRTPLFWMLPVAIAVTACGGGRPSTSDENVSPGRAAGSPTATGKPDVTSVDVCELVPAAEVAAAVDGQPGDRPPTGHAYPGAESECWYEVARGSGRTPEVIGIFLYPPESFVRDREPGATEIPGLGDGAYSGSQTDISQVVVLADGLATIDARAGSVTHAKNITALVLRKLAVE